eukprot:TRINITY_DN740_c0_g1_i4.p1 TRINITY_DN740_c0_g1~~TRINITY_DN740_c0_g1_i4.p1  ORF type:complete len:302 (-),score=59.94 TRINITY_DN740_c0_g1_i4:650-1555(-)
MSAIKKSEDIVSEIGEIIPGQKWKQKEFYYIDYKRFIDVVRYRIWAMGKKIEEEISKGLHNQQYVCPSCKNVRYTALDANRLINRETLLLHCERCKSELQEEDSSVRAGKVEAKTARMMDELKKIIAQLQLTEGMTIQRPSLLDVGKKEDTLVDQNSSFTGPNSRNSARPGPRIVISSGTEEDQFNNGPKITLGETQSKAPLPWLAKPTVEEKQEKVSSVTTSTVVETFIDDKDVNYYPSFKEKFNNIKEETEAEPQEELRVKVGQRSIPISEVTNEDREMMTAEEDADYLEKYKIYTGEE